MDANELHGRLKPLPNDFDEFIRECFNGAWTGYVGTVYPEAQYIEEVKPEKMLYCSHCKQYFPTDIKVSGKERTLHVACPNCLEMLRLFSMSKKKNTVDHHQTF